MSITSYLAPDKKNLLNLLKDVDTIFKKEKNIIHKDRNTTKKIFFKNKNYVVKSFKIANPIQRLGYTFFRKPKAQRSFENSQKLIKIGINSPEPVGYFFKVKNFQVFESYYISDFHCFDHDLVPVFDQFNNHQDLINEFIKVVIRMHENGFYHHDLTKRNVLINRYPSKLFSFVDNNRMSFQSMDLKMRMESISKLTNDIKQLLILAKYYSKNSLYNEKDCTDLILKGFYKSQRYKNAKKFF